jgi:hypothetical protein
MTHLHIPHVRSLDLRPPIEPEPIEWDWPRFPSHIAAFIATGQLPIASRRVPNYNQAHAILYAMESVRLMAMMPNG